MKVKTEFPNIQKAIAIPIYMYKVLLYLVIVAVPMQHCNYHIHDIVYMLFAKYGFGPSEDFAVHSTDLRSAHTI